MNTIFFAKIAQLAKNVSIMVTFFRKISGIQFLLRNFKKWSLCFFLVDFGWKKGKMKIVQHFNTFHQFLVRFWQFWYKKPGFSIFAFLHKIFLQKWFLQMGMRNCEKAKMPPCVPVTSYIIHFCCCNDICRFLHFQSSMTNVNRIWRPKTIYRQPLRV